jgi:outer membrane protein
MTAIFLLAFFSAQLFAADAGNVVAQEADPLPLYELGLGGAAAILPDYPGSNQSHTQWLPFPYLVYRGEVLRSDQRGVARARFFKSDVIEVNISASAGLPADSSRNDARQGMPNLDWLGELGPRLGVRLHKFENGAILKSGLALRGVISTDFERVDGRGFLAAGELQLDYPGFPGRDGNAFVLFTTNATDRRYNQYFYEVKPEFARAGRATYQARAGYFGSDITFGASFAVIPENVHAIAFVTLGSYDGAANSKSPLMKVNADVDYVLALIWTIERSKERAAAHEN